MNSTDICNMALAYIGQGRIASLDEKGEEAVQCKLFYNHLRRKLLSEYRWNFAERYVKLALLDKKIPRWDYVYAYPAQCLVIRELYDGESPYAGENRKENHLVININDGAKGICTNISHAYASYTADEENGELFTDYFIDALSHALAANIAVPLSGSPSAANQQYQLMQQALINAKYHSVIEDHKETIFPHKYMDGRR